MQGRPVTLPAFEAPIAAPTPAQPVQANPFMARGNPVAAVSPASPSAASSPAEAPAKANPLMPRDNPFVPAAQATPIAPPVHANPVVVPSVNASPVDLPAHASPIAPPVEASPVDVPGSTSPVAPRVQPKPVERPAFVSPIVEPEDVNPIVRPAHEERVHSSPAAPPISEAPVQASSIAAPAVEPALASTIEPAKFEPPLQVEAPSSVAPPFVAPPFAEPAMDAAEHASALEAPALTAPSVEPPVALAASVEASLPEAAVAEVPVVSTPSVEASRSEAAVAEAPSVEARPQANAFETAPTEFAGTETPIDHADAQAPSAAGHFGEAASADEESMVTSAPANLESIVAEAEIQSAPQSFPAPRPFTSSGSEMPVVLTTPPPHLRDSSAPAANLFSLGREFLPRAEAWSRKTLRAAPRALVISAPLVALFGIWAVRSLVSHSKHAPVAEANTAVVAQVAAATPAPQASNAANATPPAAPILVSNSAAPAAAPPGADPNELSNAVTRGLPALEALAQKFPNDPQVAIALAAQQAQAQRFEAAVDSVEHVISLDAKSAQSGKVMGILWRAAQSSASEPSFAALRKLGGRGSDIAFDLATTAGVRDSVRERAKSELSNSLSPDASADTRIASALLLAPDCNGRKALLERAEHEGGKRTQKMLEEFSRGSLCTSKTDKACNACLTGSPELSHALARLSAGGGK